MEDIWELPPGDKVGKVSEKFEDIWEKELSNPSGPSLVSHKAQSSSVMARRGTARCMGQRVACL